MDPWTIIGTTSAIITFVDAAKKFYVVVQDFYKSGTTPNLDRLKTEIQRLEKSLKNEIDLPNSPDHELTPQDKALRNELGDIKARVDKITQEFLDIQDYLKISNNDAKTLVHATQARFQAFRTSFLFTRKKSTIERLEKEWENCEKDFIRCVNDLLRPELRQRLHRIEETLGEREWASKEIASIRQTLDDLNDTHKTGLEKLISLGESLHIAETHLREQRNRVWILNALYFDTMDARQETIGEAENNTFQWWIDSDQITTYANSTCRVTFKDWLSANQKDYMPLPSPFHVVGKPGSGKSTLMKLIDKRIQPGESSRQQLEKWATGKQIITASFYAWKAGTFHQKSFMGLIRTLLHSILQQSTDLATVAFPKRWRPDDFAFGKQMDRRSANIPFEEVLEAFKNVIKPESDSGGLQDNQFFFLVDGLDELEDYSACPRGSTASAVAKLICDWARQINIKICVSSREENPFMNIFSEAQRVLLHMITKQDVETLATTRLMPRLTESFPLSEDKHLQTIIDSIVDKAEGVFLWVTLVIAELSHKMDYEQSLDALHRTIDELACDDLDKFFAQILQRIRSSDRTEAYATFAIAVALNGFDHLARTGVHFTLFHYSFIKDCLVTATQIKSKYDSEPITSEKAIARCNGFASRLPSLCRGLLDTTRRGKYPVGTARGWSALYRFDRNPEKLAFMHRSVFDFLRENEQSPIRNIVRPAPHLVIQSFRATAQALDPDSVNVSVRQMRIDLASSVVIFLNDILAHGRDDLAPIAHEILALEELLLHQQPCSILPGGTSLRDLNLNDLRLTSSPEPHHSLIEAACRGVVCAPYYFEWALRNYPSWVHSTEFKAWMLKQAIKRQWLGMDPLDIAGMVEAGWLTLNEPMPDNTVLSAVDFSPPLEGSPWLMFVIYFWLRSESLVHKRLSSSYAEDVSTFVAFLGLGAEPRIEFSWFWYAPPSKAFGLNVKMGEMGQAQRIQGPNWEGDRDQDLIRSCMRNFQQHSSVPGRSGISRRGHFTLRDLVQVLMVDGFDSSRVVKLIDEKVASLNSPQH